MISVRQNAGSPIVGKHETYGDLRGVITEPQIFIVCDPVKVGTPSQKLAKKGLSKLENPLPYTLLWNTDIEGGGSLFRILIS